MTNGNDRPVIEHGRRGVTPLGAAPGPEWEVDESDLRLCAGRTAVDTRPFPTAAALADPAEHHEPVRLGRDDVEKGAQAS